MFYLESWSWILLFLDTSCTKCVIFGFKYHRNHVFNYSRKTSRTLRKISLIVGLFLFEFFPFITLYAFPILDMKVGIGKDIYLLTAFFLIFNSACNPVIYALRFTEARYQLKKLVCFWNKTWIESIDKKHNQRTATYEIKAISKWFGFIKIKTSVLCHLIICIIWFCSMWLFIKRSWIF